MWDTAHLSRREILATLCPFTGETLLFAFKQIFEEISWSSTKKSLSQNICDVQTESKINSLLLEQSEPQ